jgi:hypothetical protein
MITDARAWELAYEYAATAMENFGKVNSDYRGYEEEVMHAFLELEIHFLFPNLRDSERCLLVASTHISRGLTLGSKMMRPPRTPEYEALIANGQNKLVAIKAQIAESGLLNKLSPLQLEIYHSVVSGDPLKQTN